jgi:hypothetical protein
LLRQASGCTAAPQATTSRRSVGRQCESYSLALCALRCASEDGAPCTHLPDAQDAERAQAEEVHCTVHARPITRYSNALVAQSRSRSRHPTSSSRTQLLHIEVRLAADSVTLLPAALNFLQGHPPHFWCACTLEAEQEGSHPN